VEVDTTTMVVVVEWAVEAIATEKTTVAEKAAVENLQVIVANAVAENPKVRKTKELEAAVMVMMLANAIADAGKWLKESAAKEADTVVARKEVDRNMVDTSQKENAIGST